MSHQNNIQRIKLVSSAFGDLQPEVVFVGGATVSLYAEFETYEVRETDDVDVIVEMLTYPAHVNFEEQVRARGFVDDINSPVRGRFKIKGITVDIMPTADINMGFKNIWYPDGFKEATQHKIDDHTTIKLLTAPYFIATKLEAFKNRGYRDPRQSQDFEDIVYVFENRPSIWKEMQASEQKLRGYLQHEFSKLMASPSIEEWIDCHVVFDSPPSTDIIIDELQRFVEGSQTG